MTLYELSAQYTELLAAYEAAETEEERDAALSALIDLDDAIAAKGEAYAKIMRNAQADADALAVEIKRLQAMKKAKDGLISRMKDNLLQAMTMAGVKELATGIGKWRLQKNPYSVVIKDISLVPQQYLIPVQPDVDKKSMLADFKDTGELIAGAEFVQTDGIRFR